MKVKEVERTANVAWSPAQQHPIFMAAATAAQQLDATFSTSAALELYSLNLAEPSIDMDFVHSISCESRFHKLQWGWMNSASEMGYLVGGSDNGKVVLWDAGKLANKEEAQVECLNKHKGPVLAVDISPSTDLLATGASDSDIFIWDMKKLGSPFTPGQKSQPADDVTCLAWNRQVQHILASTLAGRCVVWDLKKSEPIIRITDSMSRIKSKLVCWHPEVATQMCLASEDDHTPVIQLWDLRYATSPLKSFEGHQRGILSMAWCPQDADLLLTCGKDNRVLCWNPNTQAPMGEIVYELQSSDQWSFDVQWCPRNPSLISTCSFDSRISVFSLTGGAPPPMAPSSRIAESFPTDPFAPMPQQPQQTQQATTEPVVLKKPPKWLRKPAGASFAFGGRLVSFADPAAHRKDKVAHVTQQQQSSAGVERQVHISQVVTEPFLVRSSEMLEQALAEGRLQDYCNMKVANSAGAMEENIWKFMKGHFESDPRKHYMELLGYTDTSLAQRLNQLSSMQNLEEDMGKLSAGAEPKPEESEDQEADDQALDDSGGSYLRVGAVRSDGDASSASSQGAVDDFDQIAELQEMSKQEAIAFATGEDSEGLVTRALLMGNYEAAVEVCFQTGRTAEAMILAMAGGPSLTQRTQKRFFDKHKDSFNKLLACVVNRDFENVMKTCDLKNWKEALALAVTFAQSEQLSVLCDILGGRLEASEDGNLAANACLCYVCAGNVGRLVECWSRLMPNGDTPASLQNLVEKAMILQRTQPAASTSSSLLAQKLTLYAGMLASQGSFTSAMTYLGNSQEASLAELRDRLYNALPSRVAATMQAPAKPFGAYVPSAPAQQQQQQQARQAASKTGVQQRGPAARLHQSAAPVQQPSQPQPLYSAPYQQPNKPVPTYQPSAPASAVMQPPSFYNSQSHPGFSQPPTSVFGGGFPVPTYQPAQPGMGAQPQPNGPSYQDPNMSRPTQSYMGQLQNPSNSMSYPSPADQSRMFNPGVVNSQPVAPPPAPSVPIADPLQYRSADPGWNDPPVIQEKPKAQMSAQAPITHSTYGAPTSHADQVPPGAPSYIGGTHIYNPQEYKEPTPPPAPAPAKPVEKGPVPMEHQVLQRVLDDLTQICLQRASHNPHIKRKLEDVLRKLDILYDKLREQSLSPAVVEGLHSMVLCVQSSDYQTAISWHAHLVSHSNFSEIGGFMPGVKMLLQTASQMNVTLQ